MLSPLQAANAANISKATIHRAIKSGKLSANRQADGTYLIDPSELSRVFETAHIVSMRRDETPLATPETAVIQAELIGAKAIQAMLERQIEDLKADRDAWRNQAERLTLLPAPAAQKGMFNRIFSRKNA